MTKTIGEFTVNLMGRKKLISIVVLLILLILVPALIYGVQKSMELRSKAAYTACTVQAPCVGSIREYKSTTGVSTYVFKGMYLKSQPTLSQPLDFAKYLLGQVSITGNIVVDKNGAVILYASSIKFYTASTPTPIIRPTSMPTPALLPTTPIPTPLADSYHCQISSNGTPSCIFGPGPGYSSYQACMVVCTPAPVPSPVCTSMPNNCGPAPCGDQSLGTYYCSSGSRCWVNSCYPTNRGCNYDPTCTSAPATLPPQPTPISQPCWYVKACGDCGCGLSTRCIANRCNLQPSSVCAEDNTCQ